jgi:hypothetical protein
MYRQWQISLWFLCLYSIFAVNLKKISIILFLLYSIAVSSQHIADPSFEDTLYCPLGNQMSLKHWYIPAWTSPDNYMQNCFMPTYFGLESTKQAYSEKGFIGIILYDSLNPNASEFIETSLINPLVQGKEYCISLFAVASSRCNFNLSNIHIGFREDSTFQGFTGKLVVDTFYSLVNAPLKDTVNWTKLSLRFTAMGNEKYLSIGNFSLPEDLNIYSYNAQFVPPYLYRWAYYFFDLITLEECPPDPVAHFAVYPNPSLEGTVYVSNYADTNAVLHLYNALGQRVAVRELPAGENGLVAFEGLASGMYIVVYQTANGYREERKVVVLKGT